MHKQYILLLIIKIIFAKHPWQLELAKIAQKNIQKRSEFGVI
jgi:hypothetical protein